jgi:hypothetical protein
MRKTSWNGPGSIVHWPVQSGELNTAIQVGDVLTCASFLSSTLGYELDLRADEIKLVSTPTVSTGISLTTSDRRLGGRRVRHEPQQRDKQPDNAALRFQRSLSLRASLRMFSIIRSYMHGRPPYTLCPTRHLASRTPSMSAAELTHLWGKQYL